MENQNLVSTHEFFGQEMVDRVTRLVQSNGLDLHEVSLSSGKTHVTAMVGKWAVWRFFNDGSFFMVNKHNGMVENRGEWTVELGTLKLRNLRVTAEFKTLKL